MTTTSSKHKNDIYGDIEKRDVDNPAIPAATVVLLRERNQEVEVLMLRKNSKYAFGGMWVFPGGAIESDDQTNESDDLTTARNAAVRETLEEANLILDSEGFHWFAHWTPPASTPKRFSTWFFVAEAPASTQSVKIDDQEIKDHQWLSPKVALERHAQGEIDLAPPTWVTLYHISQHGSMKEALSHFESIEPRYYETHLAKSQDGTRIAMWSGDAGYEDFVADVSGPTHRLVMHPGQFEFLHSAVDYS